MSWQITNRGTAGGVATVSQAAPAGGLAVGVTARCRSFQVMLAGSAAGTDRVVVRDGATGAGTIIWSGDLSVPANGSSILSSGPVDLRASPGNALTVETVSGVTSDYEDVNAQGDFVPVGWPFGM